MDWSIYFSLLSWLRLVGGVVVVALFVFVEVPFVVTIPIGWQLIVGELIRVRKLVCHLDPSVTVENVRAYYLHDAANRSLNWQDQATGINRCQAANSSKRPERY